MGGSDPRSQTAQSGFQGTVFNCRKLLFAKFFYRFCRVGRNRFSPCRGLNDFYDFDRAIAEKAVDSLDDEGRLVLQFEATARRRADNQRAGRLPDTFAPATGPLDSLKLAEPAQLLAHDFRPTPEKIGLAKAMAGEGGASEIAEMLVESFHRGVYMVVSIAEVDIS